MRYTLLVCMALFCFACADDASVRVNGEIGGQGFDAKDGFFATFEEGSSSKVVVILDHSGACDMYSTDTVYKGMSVLMLVVGKMDRSALDVGEYPVQGAYAGTYSSRVSMAVAMRADSMCEGAYQSEASGGSVTVDTMTASHMAGSFTLQFRDSPDSVTGTFDVPFCEIPQDQPNDGRCI